MALEAVPGGAQRRSNLKKRMNNVIYIFHIILKFHLTFFENWDFFLLFPWLSPTGQCNPLWDKSIQHNAPYHIALQYPILHVIY